MRTSITPHGWLQMIDYFGESFFELVPEGVGFGGLRGIFDEISFEFHFL